MEGHYSVYCFALHLFGHFIEPEALFGACRKSHGDLQ